MFKLTLNERNGCASFTLADMCNAGSWLSLVESNHQLEDQNLACYRYTKGHYKIAITADDCE